MRFLLKPSSPSIASTSSRVSRIRAAAPASASESTPPVSEATSSQNDIGASKTWAQQCGSNCGCVLRFEAQLLECSSRASPTIVRATYHAKRVLITSSGKENKRIQLKPLTNQRSQPILTSCTCPTLHHIAKQAVEHLEGKTLAQLRNEMNMGVVGTRSSVAYRHTALREYVLPMIDGKNSTKFGIAKKESTKRNANLYGETYNPIQHHLHCYDLVEDSLLSMVYERVPSPRSYAFAESYSPTLGEYFRMYNYTGGGKKSAESMEDTHQVENSSGIEDEFSFIHGDWQRRSPSSFFLFGDEFNGSNTSTSSITRILIKQMKDSISNRLLGNEITKEKIRKDPPTTSYLQLLDRYGIDNGKQEVNDVSTVDDWLEYVDRNKGDLA